MPKVLLSVPAAMTIPEPGDGVQLAGTTGASPMAELLSFSAAPGIGPIPPPNPPFSPLLTPAQRAQFSAWAAGLPTIPPKPTDPGDLAYQLRVAGPAEYLLPTGVLAGNGKTIAADGIRPADGALVEAKNVRTPGCTPRTLANLGNPASATKFLAPGDQAELAKYQQALAYPGTEARYLELDTNDDEAVGYWQFLAATTGAKTNVRYVP